MMLGTTNIKNNHKQELLSGIEQQWETPKKREFNSAHTADNNSCSTPAIIKA